MTSLIDLLRVQQLRRMGQTQIILACLVGLTLFGILSLIRVGIAQRAGHQATFIAWSFLAALASFLAGSVLGLLFGLPSVGSKAAADARAAADGAPPSTYTESTSLEQVADWLTKIIVGLTLTQFRTWSEQLTSLSATLTSDLLCRGAARGCGVVPGGSIIGAFSLAGFLVAYLWMRRFFIKEMVTRDRELQDIFRQQQQDAKNEGRVQKAEDGGWLTSRLGGGDAASRQGDRVAAILADGKSRAVNGAQPVAAELAAGADADDPWRGVFGGSASNGHAALTATVSPVPAQADNYQIDLTVAGLTPDDQKTLAGRVVLFYLHPTFGAAVKSETFGIDGRATLTLFGYGAFTVGALLEDGSRLELNLAELPGAPTAFKNS